MALQFDTQAALRAGYTPEQIQQYLNSPQAKADQLSSSMGNVTQQPMPTTSTPTQQQDTGGGGLLGDQGQNITKIGEFGGSFASPLFAPFIGGGSELLRQLLYGGSDKGTGENVKNILSAALSAETGALGGKLFKFLFHPVASLAGKLTGDLAGDASTIPLSAVKNAATERIGSAISGYPENAIVKKTLIDRLMSALGQEATVPGAETVAQNAVPDLAKMVGKTASIADTSPATQMGTSTAGKFIRDMRFKQGNAVLKEIPGQAGPTLPENATAVFGQNGTPTIGTGGVTADIGNPVLTPSAINAVKQRIGQGAGFVNGQPPSNMENAAYQEYNRVLKEFLPASAQGNLSAQSMLMGAEQGFNKVARALPLGVGRIAPLLLDALQKVGGTPIIPGLLAASQGPSVNQTDTGGQTTAPTSGQDLLSAATPDTTQSGSSQTNPIMSKDFVNALMMADLARTGGKNLDKIISLGNYISKQTNLNPSQQDRISGLQSAQSIVNHLQQTGVPAHGTLTGGGAAEKASLKFLGGFGVSPQSASANTLYSNLAWNIARAFNGSRISDKDIKLMTDMVPTLSDEPRIARVKLNTLSQMLKENEHFIRSIGSDQPDISSLLQPAQ